MSGGLKTTLFLLAVAVCGGWLYAQDAGGSDGKMEKAKLQLLLGGNTLTGKFATIYAILLNRGQEKVTLASSAFECQITIHDERENTVRLSDSRAAECLPPGVRTNEKLVIFPGKAVIAGEGMVTPAGRGGYQLRFGPYFSPDPLLPAAYHIRALCSLYLEDEARLELESPPLKLSVGRQLHLDPDQAELLGYQDFSAGARAPLVGFRFRYPRLSCWHPDITASKGDDKEDAAGVYSRSWYIYFDDRWLSVADKLKSSLPRVEIRQIRGDLRWRGAIEKNARGVSYQKTKDSLIFCLADSMVVFTLWNIKAGEFPAEKFFKPIIESMTLMQEP
jgi:hypothetical protein